MPRHVNKNSKMKTSMTPGYAPQIHHAINENATVPIVQGNGSICYVTPEDFVWMMKNVTPDFLISEDQPSQL